MTMKMTTTTTTMTLTTNSRYHRPRRRWSHNLSAQMPKKHQRNRWSFKLVQMRLYRVYVAPKAFSWFWAFRFVGTEMPKHTFYTANSRFCLYSKIKSNNGYPSKWAHFGCLHIHESAHPHVASKQTYTYIHAINSTDNEAGLHWCSQYFHSSLRSLQFSVHFIDLSLLVLNHFIFF